jgi:hypothetical protein
MASFPPTSSSPPSAVRRCVITTDESLDVALALADAGIDVLEISGGNYESPAMTGVVKASTRVPRSLLPSIRRAASGAQQCAAHAYRRRPQSRLHERGD